MKSSDLLRERQAKFGPTEQRVKQILLRGVHTVTQLANKVGVSPKEIEAALDSLQAKGHNLRVEPEGVEVVRTMPTGNRIVVDSKEFFNGTWCTFGLVSDTHLYSKYARLDVLRCLYDIFAEEGIKTVYHCGNIIDGEAKFNRFDLVGPPGMQRQIDYCIQEYPQKKGIATNFITGDDHEGWYINREGVNIGGQIQAAAEDAGRKDLVWLGHVEADLMFKASKGKGWMRLMHGGGGTTYAISYSTQKIVESLQGGEKPQVLLVGHYHKWEHGYPREVHVVQPGCVEDQTIFMRKLKIQAHVGGVIIRFHQASTGEINRFAAEWIPFYDKEFYIGKSRYRRW